MRKCIAIGTVALGSLCGTSDGGLTVTSYPDLPASTVVAPWPVSSTYGSTPRQKTIIDLNNVAGGSAMVNETLSTNRASAGEFRIVPGREFTLGSIAVCIGGAAHTAADMSIHLYRMDKPTPYEAPPSLVGPNPQLNVGAATYNVSTNSQDLNTPGATDNDLLGGGAGLTFTFGGGGTTNRPVEFVLDGPDQVTLTPGVYAFEIWNTGVDSVFWRRYTSTSNGLVTALDQTDTSIPFSFGNRYFQTTQDALAVTQGSTIDRTQIQGDGRRISLALYAVPEPASVGVIGLAAAALVLRRRRA
jgi:PEP-CTERM motif